MKDLESCRWSAAVGFYSILAALGLIILLVPLEMYLRRGGASSQPSILQYLAIAHALPLLMAGLRYYQLETTAVLLKLIDHQQRASDAHTAD